MTFVSYAQNYEDVVLWRALQDVKEGFYVDVGAADPSVYSVTKAFYEVGWSGINIEPTEPYFSALQAERPRDVNLRVLAGSRAGVRLLHVIKDTGLSTIDNDFAARHVKAGFELRDVLVPELELNQILQLRAGRPIHFLKIDVEGAEADVLRGIDLEKFRPWIILLETTEPSSQKPTQHKWEGDLLLSRGYEFCYFDGLNCFYVAIERSTLKERLSVPPNVFDGFVPTAQVELQSQLAQQTERADALSRAKEADGEAIVRLEQEVGRIHVLEQEVGRIQAHLAHLRAESAEFAASLRQTRDEWAAHVGQTCDELVARLAHSRDEQHAQYSILKEALGRSESWTEYINKRSLLETLFFRTDGRPVKALRRLLFHKSGDPRESFRFLVTHKNGRPRRAFSYWLRTRNALASPATQAVHESVVTSQIPINSSIPVSPREQYFVRRLRLLTIDK